MKIYFFGAEMHYIDTIYEHGFDGALFLFNAISGDKFVQVARMMDLELDKKYNKDFKYMIALRPYAMSPQYLCMINQSIFDMTRKNLQINLISGYTKEEEKHVGGIIGSVNDLSTSIDKSNYMIEFMHAINKMNKYVPDLYISTTNEYTHNVANQYKYKTIVPYSKYISSAFENMDNKRTMISIGPILRKTEQDFEELGELSIPSDSKYFTYNEFNDFLNSLKAQGFEEVIIFSWPDQERENILSFVKQYKEKTEI